MASDFPGPKTQLEATQEESREGWAKDQGEGGGKSMAQREPMGATPAQPMVYCSVAW